MIGTPPITAPWQCVLIVWGDRYPVAEINLLIQTVKNLSHGLKRVVLITDRDRPEILAGTLCRPFPDFFLSHNFTNSGCLAKLAMFEAGVVPDDVPAIYCDLDTVVLKDLSRLLKLLVTPDTIAILQTTILPFGALARRLYHITNKRHYARGNSSLVIYHPSRCVYVAQEFRLLYEAHLGRGFRPLICDDRFLSWVAQPNMRAIPSTMAVKFPTEYMQPWAWLIHMRAALPWIARRRDGLIAVTLPGIAVKGPALLSLRDGDSLTDRRGRKLIWTDRALGALRGKLIDYYRQLN